jgi:hypothetical protein
MVAEARSVFTFGSRETYFSKRCKLTSSWGGEDFSTVRSIKVTLMYCSSATIDYLSEQSRVDKKTAVIYFYWDYQSQQQQTATKFIASLLRQLLCFLPTLPPAMKKFYEQRSSKRSSPESGDFEQLMVLFFEVCKQHFETIFIALDALDECSEEALAAVVAFFDECSSMTCFKIVATSRPNPAPLQSLFESSDIPKVEVEADDSDVKNFLQSEMNKDTLKRINAALKSVIVNTVGKGTEGMYYPIHSI